MEGLPETRELARTIQAMGIIPRHVGKYFSLLKKIYFDFQEPGLSQNCSLALFRFAKILYKKEKGVTNFLILIFQGGPYHSFPKIKANFLTYLASYLEHVISSNR